MTTRFPSPARWWCAAGLLAAAAGTIIQILAGIDFPAIPPGLVTTLAAAALILLVRRWWVLAIGLLIAVWLTVGFFVSGTLPRVVDRTPVDAFAGLWIQVLGIVVTAIAATIGLAHERRHASQTTKASA